MKKIILLLILFLAIGLISWGIFSSKKTTTPSQTTTPITQPQTKNELVVVAAGDISCNFKTKAEDACKQAYVAQLVKQINPDALLLLGDIQYDSGTLEDYKNYFDQSWGEFNNLAYPTIGNHEYGTPGAKDFLTYFGERIPNPKGFYSFDLGNWHLISLNSNCPEAGGCEKNSEQEKWLSEDLNNNAKPCILAFWHAPFYSSGAYRGSSKITKDLWEDLYNSGASLLLSGHEHNYERFAPSNSKGNLAKGRGIRQFVAGTGGRNLYGFADPLSNSETRYMGFGVLKLTLKENSYDWSFISLKGDYNDSGSETCSTVK